MLNTSLRSIMREEKVYNYTYKITRFDGMYYLGMHSTNNLEDGYFGSGIKIGHSIKKYGKDKHSIEYLGFYPTLKELKAAEKLLVTREILLDQLCMNLMEGGEGGYNLASTTKEARAKALATARKNNSFGKNKGRKLSLEGRANLFTLGMLGKKHKDETKNIISEKMSGINNPQFGRKAYVNPETGKTERLKERPNGWLTSEEFEEKNKKSYSRRWYNDGRENYFLKQDDELVGSLSKGRLNNFSKNVSTASK